MVFCRGPSIRTQKNVWKWELRKTVKVGARKGGGGGGGTSLVRKDENRENEDELEIVSQSQVGDLSKNSTSRCAQLAKLLLTLYLRLHCRTIADPVTGGPACGGSPRVFESRPV